MSDDFITSVWKSGLGLAGSGLAVVSAAQEQMAWALGCMVAAASFTSIALDIRRKLRDGREAQPVETDGEEDEKD